MNIPERLSTKPGHDTFRLYYVLHSPEITNQDYNRLMAELRQMEAETPRLVMRSSPTQRIGEPVSDDLPKVQHTETMLHLHRIHAEGEFLAWYQRTAKAAGVTSFHMVVEPKINGLQLWLEYRGGDLRLAATRGDGQAGQEVSHSVRTVRNIPLAIEFQTQLQVRGGVYMPRSTLLEVNALRRAQGRDPFANPKEAAVTGVGYTDPRETAAIGLRFWTHAIYGPALRDRWETLKKAAKQRLPVNPENRLAPNPESAIAAYNRLAAMRDQLDYDIDGVVVKANEHYISSRVSNDGHHRKWAVAWMFPPRE